MAKVKYNVKGVDTADFTPVKPGMYRAKIEEVNDWSGQYGAGMEVVLSITSDSKGKKKDVEGIGSKLWTYIYFDHEPSAFRLAEFIKAIGAKESGTLDTDKLVGKEVQVRVKPDRNDDGEYRPRVGKLLALAEDAGEEPDEPEDEPDEEDEDDDGVDLDELDRAGLKKFIKDNEIDVTVKKSMSDDDIRAAISEASEDDEEEEEEPEEEEPEEDEDDDDGVDLDELSRADLKKFIKENDLDVKVTKGMSDDDIRSAIAEAAESDDDEEDADDEEEEEEGEKDEAPDYNSWSQTKLKAELKERGLKVSGDFTKRKAVNALKKDDASDDEPF